MIDELDVKILNLIQENAKITRTQLSEETGITTPAVGERLHKLEDRGIISGYYTKVDRKYFGYDIMVFVFVISESSVHYSEMVERAVVHPNILECHSILGDGSHLLKAIVKNTSELEKLLSHIQSWPGVLSTKTSFVLSTAKETSKINL
ncbi:MAG: Lrp/AsnC family transcriptional regulator [Ignavibacteriaceae bacterium]|nr:Lrp/AsnC family transcriptional regulator [Ignavibacteriaceae bacterium]NUM72392.1 Lrp/AsnC family transcriptional regulator [Ignavibacteriaceae bacterium]